MTDKNNKDVPSDKGQTSEQPSGGVSPESGETKTDEALLEVPDNLRGKSVEELTKMYQNLEKKLGEQSAEVGEARKKLKEAEETKKNVEILLGAIYADPKRYQEASSWIKDYVSGSQTEAKPSESGEGAKTGVQPTKVDDTRRALQNQILVNFYKKHGLDQLPDDERRSEQTKIATAFADLVDPGGTKPATQLLDQVPLDRLPRYLESAYVLANTEKIKKESREQGLLAAEEKRQASIGTLPSTSGEGEEKVTLSAEERAVAEKIGVKPEDYAKQKAEILRGGKKKL